ncbi:hypothetical protein GCM10008018_48650 [Paenibacillus marchantiophytorum]|uniref:Uncharacterized protein n=1 Tax=Paenibacillus marchantiophytorum TaxID=1619310 RepID=A0ABQ1F1M6_9BACL|nr:hypothetical protein GCM10008018_48650 [Paenibacillus marchantiophytorum]
MLSTYHAGELSKKDTAELPAEVHLIEVEQMMVGYGVVWESMSAKQMF